MTSAKQDTNREPAAQGTQLADAAFLHRCHEIFYTIFQLPLDWIQPDNKMFTVCGKAHCNPLCSRIMEVEAGAQWCFDFTMQGITEALRTRKPAICRCHAGFYDVVIPIFIDDKYLGSLTFGQYLLKKPSKTECEKISQRLSFLNFQPGELERYYANTKVLTSSRASALIELLQLLGNYICQTYGRWQFLEAVGQQDRIRQSTQYIQHHYAMTLTVDGLARAAGMSKSNFMHSFSRQTGYSPIEYLNRYRISQAAEMLKNSHLNISEVAYQCGFLSIAHFNRLFLRYTGKTPRESRLD